MTTVSHPLISEIVSAPARSRPQAPVRDEDRFVVPEERPIDKARADRSDHPANPIQPVSPVHPIDAVTLGEIAADQPAVPNPTSNLAPGNGAEVAPEHQAARLADPGLLAPNIVPAGTNGQTPAPEIAAAASPVVAAPVQSTTNTETPNTPDASSPEADATAVKASRTAAAQLVGANPGQANPDQRVAAVEISATDKAHAVAPAAATASNSTQNTAVTQQIAAALPVSRPVDRAAANNTTAASPDVSGRADADSRNPAANGSSVLPATMAVDTDNTVTKPVTATAASSGTNTQVPPQTNNQILAQALAGAVPEPRNAPAPSLVSPTVSGDTMGVTQSFNAEMRAAIDAPTQAAAYTARGAVTPQPATQQIAMQISRAADQGLDRLSVQLKPAELGKVTIDLEIGPDNRLLAVISAERSETLDLLQRDARSLEKALAEAGVEMDSGNLEFSLQGQDGSAENDSDQDNKLIDGAVMLSGDAIDPDGNGTLTNSPLILPDGRLDIQV